MINLDIPTEEQIRTMVLGRASSIGFRTKNVSVHFAADPALDAYVLRVSALSNKRFTVQKSILMESIIGWRLHKEFDVVVDNLVRDLARDILNQPLEYSDPTEIRYKMEYRLKPLDAKEPEAKRPLTLESLNEALRKVTFPKMSDDYFTCRINEEVERSLYRVNAFLPAENLYVKDFKAKWEFPIRNGSNIKLGSADDASKVNGIKAEIVAIDEVDEHRGQSGKDETLERMLHRAIIDIDGERPLTPAVGMWALDIVGGEIGRICKIDGSIVRLDGRRLGWIDCNCVFARTADAIRSAKDVWGDINNAWEGMPSPKQPCSDSQRTDPIKEPEKSEKPLTNDGRKDCVKCAGPLKRIEGFSNAYDYCEKCKI